jgi:hypothetical protein
MIKIKDLMRRMMRMRIRMRMRMRIRMRIRMIGSGIRKRHLVTFTPKNPARHMIL